MTGRSRLGQRLRGVTAPQRDTASIEAEVASKPSLIRKIVMASLPNVVAAMVIGIGGATIAFVVMQQQVGAVVSEQIEVKAELASLGAEGRANTARIIAVESTTASLARMREQLDVLIRQSAEHGAILRMLDPRAQRSP
jgi:hypothetical protein